MVLDRIQELEAKLQKLLSIPAIAKIVADHEQGQADALKKATEQAAENDKQAREANLAAQRQAAVAAAVNDGRDPPKYEDAP